MNIKPDKPLQRAIAGVRSVAKPLQNKSQLQVLRDVLAVASLADPADLAPLIGVTNDEVRSVLSGNMPLSGGVLAEICSLLNLHPKVIQQTMHFRQDTPPKKGRQRWQGPDKVLVDGHTKTGQTFLDAWHVTGKVLQLSQHEVAAIKSGRKPISLEALRLVGAELKRRKVTAKYRHLVEILDQVPDGFRTKNDILSIIASQKDAEGAKKMKKPAQKDRVVWSDDNQSVTIDGREYSLLMGTDMKNVGLRIEKIRRSRSGTNALSAADLLKAAGQPGIGKKTSLLTKVSKGEATLERKVLEGVATLFDITVVTLFTGENFPVRSGDPVQSTDAGVSVSNHWARDLLFDRKRVKLREGVDPFDLIELYEHRNDPSIDWVAKVIELTEDGKQIVELVNETAHKAQKFGRERTEAFLAMLSDRLRSRFQAEE